MAHMPKRCVAHKILNSKIKITAITESSKIMVSCYLTGNQNVVSGLDL